MDITRVFLFGFIKSKLKAQKVWKRIGVWLVIAIIIGFCLLLYNAIDRYELGKDEIVIHIQFDTKEDIGLLIYDYCVNGHKYSGGTSNADQSMLKHDSENIIVWNKDELDCLSDAVSLSIQFRIITEYMDPNFGNVYPEEITRYIEPINFEAHFGESYSITIIGDKTNGYKAMLIR